ncbi:MAG: cell envelope integrity protein TolA [Deltaproteobacteria bacterium]|nr:MAG: cell envelope integrity protein TolA [Deltaproteobacteria bacterium]
MLPLFLASLRSRTVIIYSPVYTVDLVSPEKVSRPRGRGGTGAGGLPIRKRRKGKEGREKSLARLKAERERLEKEASLLLTKKLSLLKQKKSLEEKVSRLQEGRRAREEAERALSELQRKIRSLEREIEAKRRAGTPRPSESGGGKIERSPSTPAGGITRETASIAPQIKAYLNRLDEAVRSAWVVPRALVDNREDLMVQVRITIETDGSVSSIVVERPSGNSLFDDSVIRAIQKASPLPVPPEELREGRDYYEVGFRFHYFPPGEKR